MIPLIMRYLIPILLLTSTVIFANEKKASECLDIKDPTLRLSCYDSLFKKEPIEDPKLAVPQKKQDKIAVNKDKQIKKYGGKANDLLDSVEFILERKF